MATLKLQLLHVVLLVLVFQPNIFADDFRSWRWAASEHSRLSGHVMETNMAAVSLLSCLILCGTVPGCQTVNHCLQDGACELNAADARWNGIEPPASDPKFVYYQKIIPTGPQVC